MSRGPVLVISVVLSLMPVGSALGGDVPAAKTPVVSSDTWQAHRSERGNFSIDVPVTWTIEERLDARGVLITTLTPPSGASIAVISQSGASLNQDGVSTTVVGSDRTYVITSNRRRDNQRLYDRVLASFRIRQ